jgi:hypothetical protein
MNIKEFENVQKFKIMPNDEGTDDVRFRELSWLAKYLPSWGLNLEFGVYSGNSINCLATAAPELDFYGFDSFTGLPEDWDTGEKQVKKEAFSLDGNLPEVVDNVTLIKGQFEDTIPTFLKNTYPNVMPISYMHIDCDLYSSTNTILKLCDSKVVPGTIIRFDELACWRSVFGEASPTGSASRVLYSKWTEHEWKALNEWLEEFDRKVIPLSRNWFQGGTVMVTQ